MLYWTVKITRCNSKHGQQAMKRNSKIGNSKINIVATAMRLA
jgi:hypothetical protein